MEAKEKAIEILEKINNGDISKLLWDNCSYYAKKDLIRKSLVVVDEILLFLSLQLGFYDEPAKIFFNNVRYEIVNFNGI